MPSIIAYSGIVTLGRRQLEEARAAGQKITIKMTGLLIVKRDVSPALAMEAIGSVSLRGIMRAPAAVKQVLRKKQAAY